MHPSRYVKGGLSRSLTVRNLQLSLYGLPFSMAYMWFKDGVGRHNLLQVSLPLHESRHLPRLSSTCNAIVIDGLVESPHMGHNWR